jgi:ribonuclease P protein component
MRRDLRLTSSTDFKRVRRDGRSYAHPLALLLISPNHRTSNRFGILAGRSVGGAVERNRAKRRLREALRSCSPTAGGGWDVVLIARGGVNRAAWEELRAAVGGLLQKAGLDGAANS